MTVTSSPRLGCAWAPTDSIRAITACTWSSVAVGFITIIILRFLLGLGVKSREAMRWRAVRAHRRSFPALDPQGSEGTRPTRPAERLAKSPIPSGEGAAARGAVRDGRMAGVRGARDE